MSDLTDRLDQIKARAGAATKGPWEVCAFDSGHSEFEMSVSVITASAGDRICDMDGLGRTLNEIDARDDGVADAEFIAHARTDVPALEAALRAVHQIAFDPDTISALEHGTIEFGPNLYESVSGGDALGYARDALRDIRCAIEEALS